MQERDMQIVRALCERGYSILNQIGKGGFGTVYTVISEKYQTTFVAKLISRTAITSGETEIDNLMLLTHPNIIKVYEYFTDGDFMFLILEYCCGGSVMDMLTTRGRLANNVIIEYAWNVLQALQECHLKRIAHLDLKPANILIDSYGRAKLADFGLSKIVEGTKLRDFSGSREFQAPEQLDKLPFDPFAADIWSLGVTFYWMATAKSPFNNAWAPAHRLEMELQSFECPKYMDPQLAKLLRLMINPCPKSRPTVSEILGNSIFDKFRVKETQPLRMNPLYGSGTYVRRSGVFQVASKGASSFSLDKRRPSMALKLGAGQVTKFHSKSSVFKLSKLVPNE